MKDPFEGCTKHFCIIGTPKCGTCSLEEYLIKRFPGKEARRIEQFWVKDAPKRVKIQRPPEEWHYVITLRDNVERIWSSYHYFQMNEKMSLEEYLNFDAHNHSLGTGNPIRQADYDYWLGLWKDYNPIVVWLDDLKKLDGFPHSNPTKGRREYPEITEDERNLIISYLENGVKLDNGRC